MAFVAFLLAVFVGVFSSMAAMKMYDEIQRLENRVFLLERALTAEEDRAQS